MDANEALGRAIKAKRHGLSRSRVVFLCWYLALLSVTFASGPLLAQQPSHKVLILDEGDFTRPYFVGHAFAIREALTRTPAWKIDVDIEMLDIDRYPDRDHRNKLLKLISDKHKSRPPEVIVAQGAGAIPFADELRRALSIDTPIVFTAASDVSRRTALPKATTGVESTSWPADQAKLALRLLPKTRHIAVIGNTILPGTYPFQNFHDFSELAGKVDIIDLVDMPVPQLFDRIASLPDHTVICYYGLHADVNGRVFLPHESLPTIVQLAKRPVFVPTSNLMGYGATGGLMTTPQDGTKEVAALVRRALAGEKIGNIPPLQLDVRRARFDARELAKWDIPRSRLPQGSELMFYEPSVWERYWREIAAVAVVLVVQTILIVMLAIEYRRRRHAELEFRRSMSELAYLNRSTALGELSASIAHELNQPLAAILSNTEAAEAMLDAGPRALEELRSTLADIRRDDQRASDIIRSMRSLYSKTQFNATPLDINSVIEEMLAFVAWEAKTKEVGITSDLERNLPKVIGDRVQLDQVILNLMMNAIEAAQARADRRGHVRLSTRAPDASAVEVCVEDDGCGIPEEALSRIFDPHYTTKEQGMGMGLSISRTIIEAHGSRLVASNIPTGGARFCFTLSGSRPA